MSFASEFNSLAVAELSAFAQNATAGDVEAALARSGRQRTSPSDFAALISPRAAQPQYLEAIAQRAHELTIKHFGRVIRFFVPLYLSNECINICKYCGFSRDNPILRVTLTLEQVVTEARYLRDQGFRHILLVAGEHPHFVSDDYLRDCVARLHREWPSISLEVGPLEVEQYRPIVQAGAEGLVVYQETYDRGIYDALHVSGPKKDFEWRLETPERAYAAGFKRLGIGALLGLGPWRNEAVALAAHTAHLLRKCWMSQLTISVPRMRPAAGGFKPAVNVSDHELVQFVCALRLTFPEVGIVLSTRESPKLRDNLIPLGITLMSAGSHTEPGGYTGQGREKLHVTKGGRFVKPPMPVIESEGEHATVQFEIADNRTPAEVAVRLEEMGYETVWKDWEGALNGV
ncbi:MAG TPA: 2-iminoacetate synthase ThiH [Verrucomicrobiae bacterium]|nr:2-iminoacetate synthase ThiH [Verrucomicrobiae bacterium]